jgi:1,4-dihydroxy-2-naphthoyl-CoA hydrolase
MTETTTTTETRRIGGILSDRLGIRFTELGAERSVATMPVEGNTQTHGILHGGASAALAETVASVAANLHAGEGQVARGVELSATHHRSASSGTVTAVATALHLGRTLASYEIVVSDDAGRRLSTARLTCAVIEDRRTDR